MVNLALAWRVLCALTAHKLAHGHVHAMDMAMYMVMDMAMAEK